MTTTADNKSEYAASDPATDGRHSGTIIVDYGRGNLFGLVRAFEQLGERPIVTGDPESLRSADRIVLPGVGAFGDAMAELNRRQLVDPLIEVGHRGIPFLGICVGCQVMLQGGDEYGQHEGLNLFKGRARRLPEGNNPAERWRIPNVGWRSIEASGLPTVVDHLAADDMVYFAHSYAPYAPDAGVVAATMSFNGHVIPVALQQCALVGLQFHPERSGPVGLSVLERFLRLQPATAPT